MRRLKRGAVDAKKRKGRFASSLQNLRDRQFLGDLARLGASARKRLETKLRQYVYSVLEQEPHLGPNIKRLKDWDPPPWRYRVGAWRFFYEIDEGERIGFMTVAEHRKQAYR